MDWTKIDWAVVLATLISPIVAIGITLWYQNRDRAYQRRLAVFTTMMRLRRHQMSGEYVGALNLVPVEFHNVTDVLQRYKDLMAALSDPAWRGSDDAVRRLNELTETRATELLSAMAKCLSIRLEQMDILRGAYAPQGWLDEEALGQATRHAVLAVLSGARPLAIKVISESNATSAPRQTIDEVPWGELAAAIFQKKI